MNKLEQAARELLDAMKCKSLRVITQKETALREALAEQAEQRPQNCGTGYCSCIECPYEAEQAEQEPLMDYERINALREGEQNGAEDAYFFVRPENDTPTLRKMFCQGFERGFHKGLKYATPVQQVDLTDDEIDGVILECALMGKPKFARAVIAADREKNRGR